MRSRSLVFTAPGKVELREMEIPEPGPGEVLVGIAHSCVSPGTESRVLAGLQDGAPPFPLIPGYSAGGTVLTAGSGVEVAPGTNVFCSGTASAPIPCCWGGHVAHAVVDASSVVPVPDGVSLRHAAAAKLAAIAFHGAQLAKPQPGEKVVVLGLGPIGFFSALVFRSLGADVAVNDLSEARRAAASTEGLVIGHFAASGGADIVVDATGAPSALCQAALLAKELPWDGCAHSPRRLLIQGSYGAPPPLPYNEAFSRELHVLVPRDHLVSDLHAVLDLMARGLLPCDNLVGDFGDPSNAQAVYEGLAEAVPVTGCFSWR